MAEIPQPNPEQSRSLEPLQREELLRVIGADLREISSMIQHVPDPPGGIKLAIESDVSFSDMMAGPDGSLTVKHIGIALHEQDSKHEVWDIQMSGNYRKYSDLDNSPRSLWAMFIRSDHNARLLVGQISPAKQRPDFGTFKEASDEQLEAIAEEILSGLRFDARLLYDGYESIGYDFPDSEGAKKDFEFHLDAMREQHLTIPGLMENGKLLKPSRYPDLK